jgi:hypothetical protein
VLAAGNLVNPILESVAKEDSACIIKGGLRRLEHYNDYKSLAPFQAAMVTLVNLPVEKETRCLINIMHAARFSLPDPLARFSRHDLANSRLFKFALSSSSKRQWRCLS